jgi:peptide/nickel transport system permease protein
MTDLQVDDRPVLTTTPAPASSDAAVSFRRATARRALRTPQMRIGLALVVPMLLVALVGPYLAPHTTSEFAGTPFTGSTPTARLGTDYLGHDVLSRVLFGGRTVLWMALAAATLGMVLGVVGGLLAAYTGGRTDSVLTFASDFVLSFPFLVLPLLFVSMLGPKLWLVVLLVGVGHTPRVLRMTRAVTLDVANREFVQAAEVVGTPRRAILFGEILPNITTPLLVEYGIRVAWSIATIAAINFLGAGVQSPTADWGLMLNENRSGIALQPLAMVAPMLCIALFTVGINLMAEGVARAVGRTDGGDR